MMKKSKIPPLGAIPLFAFEEQKKEERINELKEAVKRFLDANYPLPIQLVKEYSDLVRDLPTEEKDEFDKLAEM